MFSSRGDSHNYLHTLWIFGERTIQATEITKTHQEQTINKRIHNKSHGGQS